MADLMGFAIGRGFCSLMAWLLFVCLFVGRANGSVVLVGKNLTVSFDDAESAFGPEIEESGEKGIVYISEPLDACSPLTNQIANNSTVSKFALIMRGGCTFYDKVINAQNAGFKLAIIYDDSYHNRLITMAGEDDGVTIPSIFLTRESGETLQSLLLASSAPLTLLVTPSPRLSAVSLTSVFLVSLIAAASVILTCRYMRRRRRVRRGDVLPRFGGGGGGGGGMEWEAVRRMECVVFEEEEGEGEGGSGASCVVCLEEYGRGEKLRVLPCRHRFHMNCIDSWLTKWRTFCPICKQDARSNGQNPPPSESTPLLTSLNFSPSPSLAHFLPFSNYLSFANRSSLAQILRLGPSNSSSFWFGSNGPSG